VPGIHVFGLCEEQDVHAIGSRTALLPHEMTRHTSGEPDLR